VGLAQSLLNDPKIVFLDEPQSGLDPFGRKEVRDLILSLRDAGKTVFFSSHILQDAELICDRVAILHKGQRIALGPLSEMLSAKVKEYEVAFSDAEGNLVEHAQQRAVRFVQRPNEYLAQFEREEDARALVQEILSGRAKLNSFIARKETLEEYFIREIESKQREEKAAAVAGGVA
ncbi:MAG TPA: ABC transporter ATP-binding protein, partial [Candidatus Sumerlaeota bacterium]|nr:ABC transporter ATP-binding protein [Candidatus Sumerlaeota bacterium]